MVRGNIEVVDEFETTAGGPKRQLELEDSFVGEALQNRWRSSRYAVAKVGGN